MSAPIPMYMSPPFLLRSQCPPRVPSQTCSALLGQLRARYGESHRHLRLAMLHAVTNSDGSLNAIVRSVGRPKGDISRVLWDFVDGGVLEVEPVEDEEGTEPAFLLTPKGDVLMDVWHAEVSVRSHPVLRVAG